MKILFTFIISTMIISSSFPQEENQTIHNFQKEVKITLAANYLLYLPADYNTSDSTFPLVLFLHGAGERGTDLEKVKIHGIPKLINQGKEFPFIVVSPQCVEDKTWDTDILSALLDEIELNFRVDKNRIYVTGLSMGGNGTWSLAIAQPNRFAAIAPVCGWNMPSDACTIKDLPIWVFHGTKDNVIPIESSEFMVERLKSCGSNVKFTIYPEANHDAWTETYNNEELYKWFLEQSLDKTRK
ncbi:MAG: prolyl oligopeptidase family serine peptidase [Ignavibacteriota bacterium]